jgi:hypothetical protein
VWAPATGSVAGRELENWGFSPDNFVPTIYNLIPWSFLVDYFSNIGDVIDAMSIRNVGLAWGCKTTRQQVDWRIDYAQPVAVATDPNFFKDIRVETFTRKDPVSKATVFSRERISDVTVGVTDISFRIPGVDNPRKWLNIAALASLRR